MQAQSSSTATMAGRSQERYSAVAALLHWTLAALLLFQLALGVWMVGLPLGLEKYERYQLHKSLGVLILGLSVVRLLWRLAVPPPSAAPWVRGWERSLARVVHTGLYGFMVGTPLLGWALVSAAPGPAPTRVFGRFPLPPLPVIAGSGEAWSDAFGVAHMSLAFAGAGLIVLHVSGALKHQLLDRRPEVQRMLPWSGRRGANP